MKLAWAAAFVLPLISSSLSHPHQNSSAVHPPKPTSTEAKAAPSPAAPALFPWAAPSIPIDSASGPLTVDELRQALVGRHLYLRGGWLSDNLHFGMTGKLLSQSAKGSFTLSDIRIDRVRITRRRVELEGVRYGIHFEDEGNWAEQAGAFDRIRVTPKKKHVLIVIDRQVIVSGKKARKLKEKAAAGSAHGASAAPVLTPAVEAETIDPGESADHLREALNGIFASDLDARMIAAMPECWQFFYQAQFKHQSIEPTDPNIVHPGRGIVGPTIVKNVVPASNAYAQKAQVAGVASYKVILGADGKPLAIAVDRPIGFGLDENAVAAIRHSTFAPARKDGKPVSSVIDLAVTFRILSPFTAGTSSASLPRGYSPITGKPSLPGPYTTDASGPHPQ